MLNIVPPLLLVTGTVFLVLLILLNKMFYKPLMEFMDNRNNSISRDLENAGKNASDVVAYYQEIEAILAEGRVEAAKIKETALNEAREKAAQKIVQKKSEIEAQAIAFANEIAAEREVFKSSLLGQVPLFQERVVAKLNKI